MLCFVSIVYNDVFLYNYYSDKVHYNILYKYIIEHSHKYVAYSKLETITFNICISFEAFASEILDNIEDILKTCFDYL